MRPPGGILAPGESLIATGNLLMIIPFVCVSRGDVLISSWLYFVLFILLIRILYFDG